MKKSTYQPVRSTLRDYLWALRGIRIPWIFLLLIFACSMVSTYAGLTISFFTGDMVDARGDVPTAELIRFSVSYALLAIAASASLVFASYASEKINLGLRTKLWRKIMYTSQRSYDSDGGEALVSRVTTDCDYASKLLTTIVDMASLAVSIGIYVTRMYRLNVQLANAMLLLIPISALCGWVYAKLKFIIAQKTQTMLARTTTYLVERTRSLTLIKTAGTQQEEIVNGLHHFDEQYKMQLKTGLMDIAYVALQRLYSILSILIPFVLGAKLVNDHVIRAGIVIVFYSIAGSVGTEATNIINSVGTIRQANGALARVINVLRLPDERKAGGRSMDEPDQDITIEEVDFSYGDKQVLDRVSCTIPKNKTTAIVGANGSGKSTLFKLIDRLYEPDKGIIAFGAANAQDYDLHAWRKAICLVAQDSPLMEGTIRDNICYGCQRPISQEELVKVAKQARVYDFVSKLPDGFDTHVAPGGTNLSGGQRQCVAIARAIMNNPDYLLLDEATSNLDAKSERMVMEALESLMQGRTTIIIAHSLATIKGADHVIVLHEGRVETDGAPSQILQTPDSYLSKVMNRRQAV